MTGSVSKPPPDWDARFAVAPPEGLYGEAPNAYLTMMWGRPEFRAVSALMLADGDGRNGTWLAQQGVTVTAVDISAVATERAQARDRAAKVEVERVVADLAVWSPPAGRRFDAAVLMYLHCEPEVRGAALGRAALALAPGGWVIVEGFAKAQAGCPGMGPGSPSLLYGIEELLAACPGFTVVEALAGRVLLTEGSAHLGEAEVVRFAARSPT